MEQRFANILFDKAFKVVICTPANERLLICLIETLIPGKRIASLTFGDKEHPGLLVSDKSVTFDLLCTTPDKEQFIVEMQFRSQDSYKDRMLAYATYPIRMQLSQKLKAASGLKRKAGKKMDYSLRPIYVISILNFAMEHDGADGLEEGLLSRYSIRNDANGELMTDALHFVYLELGRLKIQKGDSDRCRTLLEQLAYSLKYMHELDKRPDRFDGEVLRLLYDATELAGMAPEDRHLYDQVMTTELDIIAQMEFARKEGEASGLERGMEQREAEIAGRLRQLGIHETLIRKAMEK